MMRSQRVRAYRSLITGVQELQREWPRLHTTDSRLEELCGFLFATLPLSEEALKFEDRRCEVCDVPTEWPMIRCPQHVQSGHGSPKLVPMPENNRPGYTLKPDPLWARVLRDFPARVNPPPQEYTFADLHRQLKEYMDIDITLTHTTGRWWWKRTHVETYRGSGTVWHNVETGERPGTDIEARLSNLEWKRRQG